LPEQKAVFFPLLSLSLLDRDTNWTRCYHSYL